MITENQTPLQQTIHWLNEQVSIVAKKLRKARRKDKTKKIAFLENRMNYLAAKIMLASDQAQPLVAAA